ncbi:MAG: HlyD family efflux transporter periplasmic adaptor subunit [Planctomycetota bacterium]
MHPNWHPGADLFVAGAELWRIDGADLALALQGLAGRRAQAEARAAAAVWSRERFQRLQALERERQELAQAEVERWTALAQGVGGSASDLDRARGQELAARRALSDAEEGERGAHFETLAAEADLAALDAERSLLERRQLRLVGRAPIGGRALGPAPAQGSWVLPGQVVGSLISSESPRVRFPVPQEDLVSLAPGQNVQVLWPGAGAPSQAARVVASAPSVDARTGLVLVEAQLVGEAPAWQAGQSVTVTWEQAAPHAGFWIPASDLQWRAGHAGLFLYEAAAGDQGLARWLPVATAGEFAGLYALDLTEAPQWPRITGELERLYDGAPCQRAAALGE